jgi:hypothetical protein
MAVEGIVIEMRVVRPSLYAVRRLAVGVLACAALLGQAALPAAGQELLETFPDPFVGIPAPVATEATPEESFHESFQDDACMQELRQCCCCPNWTRYAIFDMLFLQRNNQAGNAPLAYDRATELPVITTQDMQSSIGTGFRAFYGELFTDRLGWEIGYTGIYGMFGSATAAAPGTLELPPPLGLQVNNFNDADSIRTTYLSNLQFAEFNVFCYDCCEECGPNWCRLTRCKRNCHCINWMAGFIWAGLDEQSSITALCCDPPEPASYNVRTSTNYFGPQIGMRGRREWCRWAVEGWWKTALCGTSAYQGSDPIVGTVSKQERGAISATDTGVGFIGQLNGTLIYRLTDRWGLRAGYNFYWLTNAALAPNQYDFNTFTGAGTGINDNGGIFLHGANLGTEYRW